MIVEKGYDTSFFLQVKNIKKIDIRNASFCLYCSHVFFFFQKGFVCHPDIF